MAPSPNRRSKTTRGFALDGSGVVGATRRGISINAGVTVVAHAGRGGFRSMVSWSDATCVSLPICLAAIWSTVVPR